MTVIVVQVPETQRRNVFNHLKILYNEETKDRTKLLSKAYKNSPNSGWAFKETHYMSWALSCLQLRKFYDEVELVTDSEGADLLINKLHLPYTSCKPVLDKLVDENPAVWALGKIAAYEAQEVPFIHVDGDIYIWKPFPKRIEEADIAVQNVEKNYPFGINLLKEMHEKKF